MNDLSLSLRLASGIIDAVQAATAAAHLSPRTGVKSMKNIVLAFIRDESGEDLIEYGLLAAFVAAVALATIITDPLNITTSLVNAYKKAKDALDK
jgi:Flp pilus assembly pilin Flp